MRRHFCIRHSQHQLETINMGLCLDVSSVGCKHKRSCLQGGISARTAIDLVIGLDDVLRSWPDYARSYLLIGDTHVPYILSDETTV